MAGILDSKKRIFDTVLTEEGRRQLAAGTLRIEYAGFSDSATFYKADISSGSDDTKFRLFFEALSNGRDQVTFETDDRGRMVPFATRDNKFRLTSAGNIFLSGSGTPASDSLSFASVVSDLLSSSIDNYKNMHLLGTEDLFTDTTQFKVSQESGNFIVNDSVPFRIEEDVTEISLDAIESFYQDQRLSHIPNYQFLPPVNKGTGQPLGNYVCGKQTPILNYKQLARQLRNKEKITITFPETSRDNNLVSQLFESSRGKFTKLDIIDFGEFESDDSAHPIKQVYFAGKVFVDRFGNGTFVNLFVLIFD